MEKHLGNFFFSLRKNVKKEEERKKKVRAQVENCGGILMRREEARKKEGRARWPENYKKM